MFVYKMKTTKTSFENSQDYISKNKLTNESLSIKCIENKSQNNESYKHISNCDSNNFSVESSNKSNNTDNKIT